MSISAPEPCVQADTRPAPKTLGVLGGMGPAATADFIAKLVAGTPAAKDDEHVPCIVINDPRIPDRTDAYLQGAEDGVLEALTQRLRQLERAGADGFVMPCNSAHHWAEALHARTRLPFLHIAQASLAAVKRQMPGAVRVAVMGTPVTLRSGFYQRRMPAFGFTPHPIGQELLDGLIMPGVRRVKGGDIVGAAAVLSAAVEALLDDGAEAIILACTEIPVALHGNRDARLIDSTAALAMACAKWARGDG